MPCGTCGRKFNPDVLGRHEQLCLKQQSKRRKVFDGAKMRAAGTEMAGNQQTLQRERLLNRDGPEPTKKSAWKAKSEEFRNAMRQARQVDKVLAAGGTAKDLPPPTYSDNSHLTPCPHCGRRFNADVAERHIPKCATTMNKPKPPPRRR